MKVKEWLQRMFVGKPAVPESDAVKQRLTDRQSAVADRLAKMQGTSRDAVLAEAYRRADRLLAKSRERNGDG